MIPLRRDPYLWIHLAGLATLPLWLDGCLAGLAVGVPVVPVWLELAIVALVGTGPILWMQWQHPFYIFSLMVVALQPETLSEERLRLLSLQRGWFSRLLMLVGVSGLWALLFWLYQLASIAASVTPLTSQTRAVGLGICALAFLLANLFVLVPATVVPLLLVSPQRLRTIPAYEPDKILRDFTVVGLRVAKLLPELTTPSMPAGSGETVEQPELSSEDTGDSHGSSSSLPQADEESSLPTTAATVDASIIDPSEPVAADSGDGHEGQVPVSSAEDSSDQEVPTVTDQDGMDAVVLDPPELAATVEETTPEETARADDTTDPVELVHSLEEVLTETEALNFAIAPETSTDLLDSTDDEVTQTPEDVSPLDVSEAIDPDPGHG